MTFAIVAFLVALHAPVAAPRVMTTCETTHVKQLEACGQTQECLAYVVEEVSVCERHAGR